MTGQTGTMEEGEKFELIALKCQSCGAPLPDFSSGYSKCNNCGTTHFLKGFRGDIFKFTSNRGVVVEIPPAIAVGEFLRVNEIPVSNNVHFSEFRHTEIFYAINPDRFKTYPIEAREYLIVGGYADVEEVEEVETDPGGLFGFGRKTELRSTTRRVLYFPVVFHFPKDPPFILNVYGKDQLPWAQKLANMINSKLGYSIKISLRKT